MSKVWLTTGSSRGLGRELAEAVPAAGHRLVATARRPEVLHDLVARYGGRVRAVALDVTDAAAARAAVRTAVEEFGRLDVVVNNAGYGVVSAIEETSEKDFRAQIETNLFGTVNVTKAALPVLRAQRSGHIIQVSSLGGRVAVSPGIGAYQTAKFAVTGFSECLSLEVRPFGVKVTIVEPGAMRTDWIADSVSGAPATENYRQTVGEVIGFFAAYAGNEGGDPARVARAIVGLADAEEPPLRLLLGSDAVEIAEQASSARAAEAEKWAAVSRSVDFPVH
ncbi:oxidoreductase [Sphaerisporangium sp. NPDC005288]|uniref:oxidoreductase n=1 Tax=Sphaerisporangium sp. NPDC005288 TaxID=3155114 RepID=UPI0033BE2A12